MELLLVVDDDIGLQKQLKWTFSQYKVVIAGDRNTAVNAIRRHEPKVVTLDLGLPPDEANASEGLQALKEILALSPKTKVIVITGNDQKEVALEAISMGAHDFYQKPIDEDTLSVIVERAFLVANLELENAALKQHSLDNHGFIGNSPKIQQVSRMVERIAPTEVTTLVLGESGTGKEVIAKAIHQKSNRINKPFIAINCASIPDNLLESELFGYERGAFTGAIKTTKGKIECANGGTLFLDEIGDMSYPLQAKILRFLQEKVIERVGGRSEIQIDAKIVCATHQNLQQMVEDRTFREDLFYRISEVTINIPPLRDRGEDILLLARFFLQQSSKQLNRADLSFSKDAINALSSHKWPGNIRELQNKIKSAVIMADSKHINEMDLGLISASNENSLALNLRQVREDAEKNAIRKALAYAEGNISNTANLLGVTRPTLYSLLEKFSIESKEFS
ncbi:MAG: PEP-CTERM-box response regulator transcription factor [Aliivibrio sp.]|uniref:PEP-CTERM-box response regulator transcription factor n=1 Tax=Aliivibrio sp. TaxID=1872443 RepID=UPI001A634F76|nr:PEP-CTERM-box response regulator transcription factor [Aliivibrio sp.]